ncbi:MAG: hypothetical protein WCX88_00375 [Patescibacteria group bacterium]
MNIKIQKYLPLIALLMIVLPVAVLAAGNNYGLDVAAEAAGLKDGKINDWRDIFVVVINGVLMLLGFLSLSITIYGGFMWMSSAGDEKKVATAKDIIKAGVIGLIVILLSLAITNAVFGFMGVKLTTWSG